MGRKRTKDCPRIFLLDRGVEPAFRGCHSSPADPSACALGGVDGVRQRRSDRRLLTARGWEDNPPTCHNRAPSSGLQRALCACCTVEP